MNYFKRLETILIIIVIALLAGAYGMLTSRQGQPSDSQGQAASQEQGQPAPEQDGIAYPGQSGRTALDLLKAAYQVETQPFGGVGEFVTAIDGVQAGSSQFWSFYVNGVQAQVGASQYVTSDGELIEWKLEEIR